MGGEEAGGEESLSALRRSAAILLAAAVREMFPDAKLATGPITGDGFYGDFELPRHLTPGDLPGIEGRMARLVGSDQPFRREELSREEALEAFVDQPYESEVVGELPEGTSVVVCRVGRFVGLCGGSTVESAGEMGPFKLLGVSAAYWRGDERRPQLQRVRGTAWNTEGELDAHLRRLEETRGRDHRKLGRELGLFGTSEAVGAGLVLWHPKGATVRVLAENFLREAHLRAGYEPVFTPHIGRANLWETSGHLDFYAESMYPPMDVEGEPYYLKPMNCPFHMEIFKGAWRSYRDLPVRYAEFGTVYRYERGGVLHGLTRVRGFTQDDGHVFCRPDQVEQEIVGALDLSLRVVRAFGLDDFKVRLATIPERYVGEPADWEMATGALRLAVEACSVAYEEEVGGGAFYGPKIDLEVKDALGREWQLSTIQFDFNLPERFRLEYVDSDDRRRRPYVIHRALIGSLERFLGLLIEHHAGALPAWLAPVQAVVVPVADRHEGYAGRVSSALREEGLRVGVAGRGGRLNARIRDAQLEKIPYILVVGDREELAGTVAVRLRSGENLGTRSVAETAGMIGEDAENRG